MGPGHAQRGRDGEFGWFCAECLPGIHHSSLSRGLVRHAWQLREALLQCPEHWQLLYMAPGIPRKILQADNRPVATQSG